MKNLAETHGDVPAIMAYPVESGSEMPRPATVSPEATGLTDEERLRVDRALRRIHESLREFVNAWPVADRTPSQLSRQLDVDRTTCQRVTSLAKESYAGMAMLDSLPGPRAFRNLITACDRTSSPPSSRILTQLRAAVDGFDELIHELGGSLSQLKRKVATGRNEPTIGGSGEDADYHARRSFFLAASHLTRRHSQTVASIGIYDAAGVDQGELRHLRMSAGLGVVAQPDAVPMVLEAFDARTSEPEDRWQRSLQLVREFTSAEWKSVDLEPSPGFSGRAMEITRSEEPSDICYYTAFPVPDPVTLDNPIEESWYILYNPAASLVFDLYLHQSVARRCLLSLDVHLWQTSFANHPHGKWQTRMPYAPSILQLGRGLINAKSSHNSRHAEMTRELFRRADVNPDEYIGFRCEERFPIWRSGYRFELDFGRSD